MVGGGWCPVRACVRACVRTRIGPMQLGGVFVRRLAGWQAPGLAAKIQGLGVKTIQQRRAQLKDGGACRRGGMGQMDQIGGKGRWEDPLYWETFCRRLQEPLETRERPEEATWGVGSPAVGR